MIKELPKEKNSLLTKLQPITFVGIGLGFLFLIFCLIPPLSARWWVIMPFGLASSIIFFLQHKKVNGIELKICFYGILIVLGIFLIRDIAISSTIQNVSQIMGSERLKFMLRVGELY